MSAHLHLIDDDHDDDTCEPVTATPEQVEARRALLRERYGLRLVTEAPAPAALDLDAPAWTWPRPAGHLASAPGEPCVYVKHGLPGEHPEIRSDLRIVRVTDQTQDPAWWRARLPGVSYEVALHPRGVDDEHGMRDRQVLGTWRPDETPRTVIVTSAERVWVQVRGAGGFVGALSPAAGPHGEPRYDLADLAAAAVIRGARRTEAPKGTTVDDVIEIVARIAGPDVARRVSRAMVQRAGARGGER